MSPLLAKTTEHSVGGAAKYGAVVGGAPRLPMEDFVSLEVR